MSFDKNINFLSDKIKKDPSLKNKSEYTNFSKIPSIYSFYEFFLLAVCPNADLYSRIRHAHFYAHIMTGLSMIVGGYSLYKGVNSWTDANKKLLSPSCILPSIGILGSFWIGRSSYKSIGDIEHRTEALRKSCEKNPTMIA